MKRHTAVLLSALLSVSLSIPTGAAEPFTVRHIAKVRTVTEAVVSPDGRQVAYLLSAPRPLFEGEDGPAYVELHLVDGEGASRPFVTGKVNLSQPAWRPGGKEISYLAKRDQDEHAALYAIPLDGGESRRLVAHETGIEAYSWAPDGVRVAFLAREEESKESKERKEKGFNQQIYEEDLQAVKVWIARVGEDGDSKPRVLGLPGSASELHWSPAGASLAVALAPTPLVDDSYMRRIVHVVEVESGRVTAQLDHAAKLGQVAWSPDGRHLAAISGQDQHDPSEGRLFVWSVEGEQIGQLFGEWEGHVSSVAWKTPDTIAFTALEGLWSIAGEIGRDGTGLKKWIEGPGPIIGGMTLSKDGGTAAFTANSPQHPQEVFVMAEGDEKPRRLTDSNPWISKLTLATQETVRHKARDGLELEGVLIRPLDADGQERHPLILVVHGGPESHVSNGWVTFYSTLGQVGAANGFAMFAPNYRGSTGRGVAFSKLGQADAAGKEFDDLVDAIDHLVETGLVDRERVGITGGSYGGYASAWGATYYTDRYAASVMFVGISDNVSKVGTTDIPFEMYAVHHRKWLWDDWDYFLKRSPIYYVKQAKTPLLILHGKDDPRVHPGQSLELYRHLKVLGNAPVRLVLYPGEGHGNRRAASRYDYSLRLLRWMEHYLKGAGGEPPPTVMDYGMETGP